MGLFKGKKNDSIHFDYAPHKDFLESEEKHFKDVIPAFKSNPPQVCCSRFNVAVEEGEIKYSYKDSDSIDETAWYIDGKWHIYFCPFCGKGIKVAGFGTYLKEIDI